MLTVPAVFRNNTMRSCFILMLVMPAFAASPGAAPSVPMTTVVRADTRTGRLVRSLVMEPGIVARQAASRAVDPDLNAMIDSIADEQGVESHLVHSVIRAESNYNANAVSPKGAQGIMQLIPTTARRFGVSNSFDTRENIQGGVRYLRFLLDYFQGDYAKAIAAYNAGESAVDKYKGIPPFAETQNYVYRVARNLKAARELAAKPVAEKNADKSINEPKEIAANGAETPRPIQTSTGSDGRVYYRTP
jgi:soluble lytic murein transglycosylase-like protein